MKTVARIVVGVWAGASAGIVVGTLAAALIGLLLCGATIVRAAGVTLDAIGGLFVAGIMIGVFVAPTAWAAGSFGGIIGPFSSNYRTWFRASAVVFGVIIGLLQLQPYLEIRGNLRPDLLEVLLHPTAGVVLGLTSAIVAQRTVAMVERRTKVS